MHRSPADSRVPLADRTASTGSIRLAGLLYLVIILCGLSAELLLRGPLLQGGPADLAAALPAALPRFRLGLLADLVMLGADIALALLFWRLLRAYGATAALAAMILRLMQAGLIAVALLLLSLLPATLALGEDRLAALLVQAHATGYDLGLIFFGANALLMAHLLRRAGGTPRVIPLALALSGLVYIGGGLARLVAPEALPLMAYAYALPVLAESALCLWLLIAGRL